MNNFTFIRLIPVLHADNSVPMLFSSGHLYPKKVFFRRLASDRDVREVDLNMQMSFLDAATWEEHETHGIWNMHACDSHSHQEVKNSHTVKTQTHKNCTQKKSEQ